MNQAHAVFSEVPDCREQARNIVPNCKTEMEASMSDVPQFNPTNIKGSIREFERWKAEVSADWPDELKRLGERALLTLKSLDQPAAAQSKAFMEASAADLQAFAAAYQEWKR